MIGDYDHLQEPEMVAEGWDYLCITNNPNLTSSVWTFIHIDDEGMDPVRLSRKYKICNHLVDSEYDIRIYIDANIQIKKNLDSFLAISWNNLADIAILYHPYHTDVTQEFRACLGRELDNTELIKSQKKTYFDSGFEDKYPQVNNRLIIRRTNNHQIKRLMNEWFNQVLNHSFRDQLSFNYVLEKQQGLSIHYIEYWKFSAYFSKKDHK